MAELIQKDKTNIGWKAKRAMGKLSPLCGAFNMKRSAKDDKR